MSSLFAKTNAEIFGFPNRWSLGHFRGAPSEPKACSIVLEIRGEDRAGYHLILTPQGYFGSDSAHDTEQEAIATAQRLLGVAPTDWSRRKPVDRFDGS